MRWYQRINAALTPSAFAGITFRRWLRVLRDNRFAVAPAYWPRAGLISLASLGNSALHACEDVFYRRKIRDTKIAPPLFILGSWRSGTTHLFNLLTRDKRFAFLNAYQAAFPHTFLLTETPTASLADCFFPKKRPQDNMAFGAEQAQEDEFAMCSAIGRSLLLSLAFPRRAAFHDRYLTLREVSERERKEWQSALDWLVRKLAFKYGRPLVLKSPGHTGRIRWLLQLFPDAKFVHICRDPFVVYSSARHTVGKVTPWIALQKHDFADLDERTLRQYAEIYEAYFEERELIPAGHLHELRFEDLEQDPVGQMRAIYENLKLADFALVEPELRAYVESQKGYQKNKYAPLSAAQRQRVVREWRRCFDAFGYATDGLQPDE